MTHHIQQNDFTGLVLAGGQSSRMGEDKAFLNINDKTLLQRTAELLNKVGACDVLINRNDFSVGSLPDIYPNHGPLSGIHSALFQNHSVNNNKPLLVLPVDMPLLSEDLLICLVEAGITMNSPVHYLDHPLPAFIPNTSLTRNYLETILSDTTTTKPSRSIKRFLSRINAVQLSTDQQKKLINANTPEQWQYVINNLPQD